MYRIIIYIAYSEIFSRSDVKVSILDKIGDVSRGASDKAKSISEANNLKRKILYEEERIVEIFGDIGKKYYKTRNEDPEGLKALCDDIDTRRRRIRKMRYELNGIRGYKICPQCSAEVNERFQFCGRCGARLPDVEDEDFLSLEFGDNNKNDGQNPNF